MGRPKKQKKENTEVVVENVSTNDAVFTEYPSVVEMAQLKEAEQQPKQVTEETKAQTLSPIEDLCLKLKEEIEKTGSNLHVIFSKKFNNMIRIVGNNGMHYCYARVKEQKNGSFLGEFLAFTPSQHLNVISSVFKKLGVVNKNGTYLSTSGLT